jgi:uncharacterized coiled-coil protein SlyX
VIAVENNSLEARISRIDERTMNIQSLLEKISLQLSDHDCRINKLEQWQNQLLGSIGVLTFLVVLLVTLLKTFT